MRRLIVFDASGSMSGKPFDACVTHAETRFPPDTPALIDVGSAAHRTTLRMARETSGKTIGAGSAVGPRMLRECALVHDEVHFYTDGYLDGIETARMPEGRVIVHIHGSLDPGSMHGLSIVLENADILALN